ncbi:hypothetical protein, partial [Calditerricola satsumensis]|uniref:hypothetical protein n=1 Tax=Calditerricola satsumensis TaxID=373054 RepID=UPI00166E25F0
GGDVGEWRGALTVGQHYARASGTAPPSGVAVPAAFHLAAANAEAAFGAVPGLLGETLKRAGLRRMVAGHADRDEAPRRLAPLLLMDQDGRVPEGQFGPPVMHLDPTAPGGWRTDVAAMRDAVASFLRGPSGVVAVEFGDWARLAAEKPQMAPVRWAAERAATLEALDRLVQGIAARVGPEDLLLVFSPSVHREAEAEGARVMPLLVYRPGGEPGVATSTSTRQGGWVTGTDVAPTVLAHFGLSAPAAMSGAPIAVRPGQADAVFDDVDKRVAVYRLRQNVVPPLALAIIGVLLVALWFMWRGRRVVSPASLPRWSAVLQGALFAVLALPGVLLVLAPWAVAWPWLAYACAAIAAAGGAGAILCRLRPLAALGVVAAGNVLMILADGLAGGPLARYALLSHDPIIGARFYGLGNEYSGVLLGASVLAASALWVTVGDRRRWARGLVLVGLAAAFLYTAAPGGGANFDAVTAMLPAFVLTVWRLSDRPITPRALLVVGTLSVGVGAAVLYGHAAMPEAQLSHIGRAVRRLLAGDWGPLVDIARRKWDMNLRLLRVSIWGKVFVTSLLVLIGDLLHSEARQDASPVGRFLRGLSGGALGTFLALLVNDSGIVAAATSSLFLAVPLLCLHLSAAQAAAAGRHLYTPSTSL